MKLVVFVLSALLGVGFQQVSATSLVSLSPSSVQTGEEFTFVVGDMFIAKDNVPNGCEISNQVHGYTA